MATPMETTPVLDAAANEKKVAHEERQAQAANAREAKKRAHEEREEQAVERRNEKTKRRAANQAKAEEQRAAKKVKVEEKAAVRAKAKVVEDKERQTKLLLGATVSVDLDAVIAHVQAAAGDAKVALRGLVPQLSVTFATPEAAQAFVKANPSASVPVSLSSRPATDFSRVVYFPKEGLGGRAESIKALRAALKKKKVKFSFVESLGRHVGVQFLSENAAQAGLEKFKSNGLVVAGVEVGEAAMLGKPPKSTRQARGKDESKMTD